LQCAQAVLRRLSHHLRLGADRNPPARHAARGRLDPTRKDYGLHIAENVLHEQRKIVWYNQLAANLIILHNVEQMSRVLAQLREEGMDISPEVLAGLSPYRTAHINRFGDYTVGVAG
jgi:hypothetical protein